MNKQKKTSTAMWAGFLSRGGTARIGSAPVLIWWNREASLLVFAVTVPSGFWLAGILFLFLEVRPAL